MVLRNSWYEWTAGKLWKCFKSKKIPKNIWLQLKLVKLRRHINRWKDCYLHRTLRRNLLLHCWSPALCNQQGESDFYIYFSHFYWFLPSGFMKNVERSWIVRGIVAEGRAVKFDDSKFVLLYSYSNRLYLCIQDSVREHLLVKFIWQTFLVYSQYLQLLPSDSGLLCSSFFFTCHC